MSEWRLTRTYQSESGSVRWDRFGPEDADPVVLLHGTPFSSYVWRSIAAALATTHRVHVWDMPGYGTSAMTSGQDVSLGAQARVFTELLAHWQLRAPTVLAHDFGGAVALRALLLHGAGYRRLGLVDPVALAPWGSPFFRLVGANTEVFEQLPAHLHEALVRRYVASASAAGLHPTTLDALAAPWLGDAGQPAFYRQIAQADHRYTDEFRDRLGGIDIPVLVCWGVEDDWIPLDRGRALAAAIPTARLHEIPGAGHLVQEDAPAELTAALLPFLHT